MKIVDLVLAQPVMQNLVERKMPVKLAYGLAKNFRLMAFELEDYDKARVKLLSDNWELDPKTNKYDIPDNEQEKWKKIHDELLETECGYQPYKIDLAFAENFDCSPGEILTLWFIFQGEGAEDLVPKS